MNDERDLEAGDASWGGAEPDPVLEARVASTLSAHADELVIADRPFDPSRASTVLPAGAISATALLDADGSVTSDEVRLLDPVGAPTRRGGRGPVVWLAGVAAAVVLVAMIVAIGGARDAGVSTDGDDDSPLVGPDTMLVPASVPDGLQLWDVGAGIETRPATSEHLSLQLIESTTSDAALLVGIAPREPGTQYSGTELTARGTTVWSRPPALDVSLGAVTDLTWAEGDVDVNAMARNLDDAATVALLDSLTFADPGDPLAGFAAPSDWTVRADETAGSGSGRGAAFRYGRSAPTDQADAEADLQVATYGPGSNYPGYLLASMIGETRDGDVAVARIRNGPSDAEPTWTTTAVWPDGRTSTVYGDGVDDATAERIALDVRPGTLDDVRALATEASDRLGAGEVLAAADLPDGRVELVGSSTPSAICFTASGSRSCKPVEHATGTDPGQPVFLGSTLVGSTWYVFGAAQGEVRLTAGSSSTFAGTGTAIESVVGADSSVSEVESVDTTMVDSAIVDTTMPATGASPTTTNTGPGGGTVPSTRPSTPAAPTATDRGWTLAVLAVPDGIDEASGDFATRMITELRPLL